MALRMQRLFLVGVVCLFPGLSAGAEGPAAPGDKEPVLRVEAGGPTSFVTALAFSADGKTLYAGGWDKVVRVWVLNDKGQFVPDRISTYRLPIGPGLDGAINALALSDDGVWLAAAGKAVFREAAGFRRAGFVVPIAGGMTEAMRQDMGTITVFNTRNQTVRLLRGHRGVVDGLAFASTQAGKPPMLLSTAQVPDAGASTLHWSARLWDVSRGESLAVRSDLPGVPVAPPRPGLAVWHTGKQPKQVRAAFAFGDGAFRVWDVGQADKLWKVKDPKYTMTVARLPGTGELLTASYGKGQARFTRWQILDTDEPKASPLEPAPAPDAFPRALGLLSRRGDDKADLAAVVLRLPGQGEEYRLQIVDLASPAPNAVRAQKLLWKGSSRQPILATSLRGRHVAVAGNQDHTIRVYALDSLLRKDKTPPQELSSLGATFHHVSFVRKGKEKGLLLNRVRRRQPGLPQAPDAEKGDLVFAFGGRGWAADLAPWKSETPALGDWRAEYVVEAEKSVVRVFNGQVLIGRIPLEARHTLSDFALLPPQGARKIPLLALATHEAGQPHLVLWNAQSGKPLRQFTGHVDRVSTLAFSADGRLLASAAEDQTVCVWSLTDLDKVHNRVGQLDGVSVRDRAGVLVIDTVSKNSPARAKLRPGDRVVGWMDRGVLRPLASPHAFYGALYLMQPGRQVVLRLGGAQGNRDVTLDVGQGEDERKPLLSLFVMRSATAADRDWIGWNPLGPYEASSPRAEKHLGWHFNTGDPKRPTRFALAAEHRKEYYREGILQKLIQEGEVPQKVEAPKYPLPRIYLSLEEGGQYRQAENQEPVVVRQSAVALKLEVKERPLASLSALSWKLDAGAEQKLSLDRPDGEFFTAPLDVKRGDHLVVVTAWTNDVPPRPVRERLALRYQPPPPKVTFTGSRQVSVKQAPFDLRALVSAGAAGEDVRVALRHQHDGKDLLQEEKTHAIPLDKPLALERTLKLRPGNNLLEVVAVNRSAPADHAEAETARLRLQVFLIEKAAPPRISVVGLRVGDRGKGEMQAIESPLEVLEVNSPRIRLVGKITAAKEALQQAEWFTEKAAQGVPLTGFVANKQRAFAFEEPLKLEPGRQTVRLRAWTENSDKAEQTVTLDYRPMLPVVNLTTPRDGEVVYADKAMKDSVVARVQGSLTFPEDLRAYRVSLLLNDKEQAEAPIIDEKAGALTARATLGPGDNRIRIKLSNAWGRASSTEETVIRYLRPPHILTLTQVGIAGKPALDLEASVRSPTPLLDTSVKVEVNGREMAPAKIRIDKAGAGLFTVRLTGVTLDAGRKENEFRLWLSNDEAECREPGVATFQTTTVLPPPIVEFLDPVQNLGVALPQLTVRIRARSISPLTRVQLVREGRPPLPVDLAKVERDGAGQQVTAEMEVNLSLGLNHLRIEADNAGGRQVSPPLVVNYIPPPLRVVVDQLTVKGQPGKAVLPRRLPRGQIAFGEIESGRVRMQGRILWGNENAARGQKNLLIRISVNGFQQIPGRLNLSARSNTETPFEADLLLNQDKDNQVRLSVLGQDASSLSEFAVDCRQPIKQQRLHILILGARGQNADVLKAEVLKAVQLRTDERLLKSPAFERVKVYRPLVGPQVRSIYIYPQLSAVKGTILDQTHSGNPMNDVLMIYYHGGEAVQKDGNFFETYAGAGQKQFGIPCDKLVEFLGDIPGAQVLLLDVDREPLPDQGRDKISRWKDDYPQVQDHVVVMRHAWQGKTGGPKEARLLTVLEATMPHAARLSEVVALMRKRIATARNPSLLVFTYLPKDLQNLLVGRLPDSGE